MISSKDRILLVSSIQLILCICGCIPAKERQKDLPVSEYTSKQRNDKDTPVKGFVNSEAFKDHLKNSDDPQSEIYSSNRFFNLIGEESFLNAETYDFYIVYLFKEISDTNNNVFVLRSNNGTVISSVKRFGSKFPFYYIKRNRPEPDHSFTMNVSSKIVQKEKVINIKAALDHSKKGIKDRIPAYDIPSRVVYYYDGHDYYGLSDFKISDEDMTKIDKLIRSSEIFQ